jgi:hypothetical protein
MDIDQSARRQARDEFQVIDPDYYDMEGMNCLKGLISFRHTIN